jgi:hypothetical protein
MNLEANGDAVTPGAAGLEVARGEVGERASGSAELKALLGASFKRGANGALEVKLGPLKEWCANTEPNLFIEKSDLQRIAFRIGQIESVRAHREWRRKQQVPEADERRERDASRLGRCLLPVPFGFVCVKEIDYITNARRPRSESGADAWESDPSTLVKQLESTSDGCEWLSKHFGFLRGDVGVVKWFPSMTYVMLLLLGREPMDALKDALAAQVVLACHAIECGRKNLFIQMRSEVSAEDFKKLQGWVHANVTLGPLDEDEARRTLIAILEGEQARLLAKAADHRQRETSDAARRATIAAFETSDEGKRIDAYERVEIRSIYQKLNLLRQSCWMFEQNH